MADCLSKGGLPQQQQTTSVVVDCLSNGGCPSPTELDHPRFSCACCEPLNPEHFQLLFVPVGVGPADPDHLVPCLRALYFFFNLMVDSLPGVSVGC